MTPAVIDVEASGRGPGSYPIEVGVVLPNGTAHCFLIRPVPEWTLWDPQAEAVHGISRKSLMKYGKTLREAAHELNGLLDGRTAYSDRGEADAAWIEMVFARAGIAQRFSVAGIETLLNGVSPQQWVSAKLRVIESTPPVRHRASTDARMIREAYLNLARPQTPAVTAMPTPPVGYRRFQA